MASRCSSVDITTRLQCWTAEGSCFDSLYEQEVYLLQDIKIFSGAQPAFYIRSEMPCYMVTFYGEKL